MNREQATSLLKELNLACDGLGAQGVMLMPPNADDVFSHGCQLHIKTSASQETIACIKPLVEKRNLAMANEPDKQLLVIYRPMKKQKKLSQY